MKIIKIAQFNINKCVLDNVDNSKGMTAKQTIDTANRRMLTLLSNKEFDQRLVKTDIWKGEKWIYPIWTGTLVAFTKKNEKVDKFIEYIDPVTYIRYVFEAGDAKGEKNVVLAINHGFTLDGKPTFTYNQDGKDTVLVQIAKEAKVDIIPNFPTIKMFASNWFLTENKFGIPVGRRVSSNISLRKIQDIHHLVRNDGDFVGLLVRNHFSDGTRTVTAFNHPSCRLGALAYKPEGVMQ